MLRRGSLFYELSMQLKEEMRHATQPVAQQQNLAANQLFSQKNSPDASVAKLLPAAHLNNLPILNLALDLDDNNTDLSEKNSDDDEIKLYFATGNSSSSGTQQRSLDEHDILKEVRFAAASSSLSFNPSLSVCNSPFRNASSFSC